MWRNFYLQREIVDQQMIFRNKRISILSTHIIYAPFSTTLFLIYQQQTAFVIVHLKFVNQIQDTNKKLMNDTKRDDECHSNCIINSIYKLAHEIFTGNYAFVVLCKWSLICRQSEMLDKKHGYLGLDTEGSSQKAQR